MSMIKATRQFRIIIALFLMSAMSGSLMAKVDSIQAIMDDLLFEKAQNIRFEYPDSTIYLLQLCYSNYMTKMDTLKAIRSLRALANIYGHHANYKASYDQLWKALFLADEAKMKGNQARLYIEIGRYYSFYKRKKEAIAYFELSLEINRELVKEGILQKADLVQNFYALCATLRELDEPALAQSYLDSCNLYYEHGVTQLNHSMLKFEEAFLLKKERKYEAALRLYKQALPWIQENDPGYQVLVYSYLGDTYKGLGDHSASEVHYQKALEVSAQYRSHIDFTPLVHEKLSDLYYEKGDYLAAYQKLKAAKELDERFFDSRSENNRPLLEIQDAFRKEKDYQKELIQKQRLAQLEHEDKVWFLQKIILLGSMVFLLVIGVIYFNYVRSKHRSEKKLIKEKQQMELQKANEIVEVKNRELAASALKLIEKEELLATLKNKLSQSGQEVTPKAIKEIVRSISISNAQNWKEFETRFIAVNKDFYHRLLEKFPKLTQGDQKLCALVKLNFSSKDMSKLMGISVESVHTTRYRLRKKMNLARDINLTEFIAKI